MEAEKVNTSEKALPIRIEKVRTNGKTTYCVKGRIDTLTSPELQKAFDQGFEEQEKNIILNLKDVEYLSSAGLRVILYVKKE